MVDAWVVGLVVTVAMTTVGWLIARLTTQNELIRTQRDTIDILRRQVERLEITTDVTDKILQALPRAARTRSGDR